jgi:predicted dehydrogenase
VLSRAREHGVAIIGCGLIGARRAKTLGAARLVVCSDLVLERARAVAGNEADATTDWQEAIARGDVSLVLVSTTNDALPIVAAAAIAAGKHVLIEKPAGRSVADIDGLLELESKHDVCVRVAFNHRYHPAIGQARGIIASGAAGDLMFVRGRYGHGGRLGYEKEWRADPARSGGGELIDQGVHLIDLARELLGDLRVQGAVARTLYWDMPVDDNAFLTLENSAGRIAFLHVSCTEWKNLFSLEIYGRNAKLHVEGLGGSYGPERLTFYRMLPEMGPPETTTWEFPGADVSWQREMDEFLADIDAARRPDANLTDARAALAIVDEVYRRSGYRHA